MIKPSSCARLFSDEAGESHFEDIEVPMSAVQYAPPAPAVHLSAPVSESSTPNDQDDRR
jgi:hypothetical protein